MQPVESHYLPYLHRNPAPVWSIFICWRKWVIFRGISARSCCNSALLAGLCSRSLSRVGVASDLSDSQHIRQPPVTSSAFTWHVKTPLKAPRHPPAPAHLSLDAHDTTKYTLICSHALSHNKTTQSCFNILPTLCTQSHVCQTLSFSSLSLSPPFCHGVTCKHTQWINLLRLDWWPAGLLLTKALPNMVSCWEIMLSCHSIWDGDPLCQSWSLAAVTGVPPSSPLWPDAARGDRADVTTGVINASQWVQASVILINITDLQRETLHFLDEFYSAGN